MERHRLMACLWWGLRNRLRLFRNVQLNAAGWAAVVGLCTSGAGIGLVLARISDAATWAAWIAAPVGATVVLASLVAADRRPVRAVPVAYGWTDDVAEVRRMASMLARAGLTVSVVVDQYGQPRLEYRGRDARRIRRLFRSAGLPFPPAYFT